MAANGKFSALETTCNDMRCTDPSTASDIDTGKSLEKAADATFVIGGVLIAASIPMMIWGGPKRTAHADAASIWPMAVPTYGGAIAGVAGTL